MTMPRQQSRFCSSFDGTRIAFAIAGNGPLMVEAPHWLSHLDFDWQSRYRSRYLERMTSAYTLLRTNQRGCGLSDRDPADMSFEAMVRDLEAAVDSAGWTRFALLGQSQGGAYAVEYAARHPDRVTHLILYGAYARGRSMRDSQYAAADVETQIRLVELGWGGDDPAFHHFFAMRFMPDATPEDRQAMVELQRASAAGVSASRILRTLEMIDVRESASRVRCPTLIMHATGDLAVPFDEGRLLATLIPDARLVSLDSRNHIRVEQDPTYEVFFEELHAFVPPGPSAAAPGGNVPPANLTSREAEILERLAQGLDNAQIAAHLDLSEKTVRNHITHIFDKIGVENRGKAIIWARTAGFGRQTS